MAGAATWVVHPEHAVLSASDHETVTVYRSDNRNDGLAGFVEEAPARRRVVARGDNIEAGDYFPAGSCQVVVLSERKNVYRVD